MKRHWPEVADVIWKFGERFLRKYGLGRECHRIFRDLMRCRTSEMGGHKLVCDGCEHGEISYNSCRNRHCPKCQAQARARWLEAREADLIDVPYFHIVFTLPDAFAPLAVHNRRKMYGILFRAASETLRTIGRDKKHLGAEVGFLAVLHTWGQKLQLHPHLHCVVAGGGLTLDRGRWIPCRSERFFLPVRVLSSLFRGKFLAHLHRAHQQGKLKLPESLDSLQDPHAWSQWLDQRRDQKWVVYAKPPFGGPAQVLKYLARYTHRVAIANSRILSLDEEHVVFEWKDYAHENQKRTLRLDAVEFLRRFLLHKLPPGFMRIRHYGFLGNRGRKEKLTRIRALLGGSAIPQEPKDRTDRPVHSDPWLCPKCGKGTLQRVGLVDPKRSSARGPPFLPTAYWEIS